MELEADYETLLRNLDVDAVVLALSEVKEPVMDRLKHSDFLNDLTGRVFLSQYEAIDHLAR